MSAYRTVVVGTDGSDSSLRAVRRAAALAGACAARLVIVCAYQPPRADDREVRQAQEVLGDDAYRVIGSGPAEQTLRTAADRAREAGATQVYPFAVVGEPVDELLDVVAREQADLLVVGNRGLNSIKGRLLGSVPSDIARRSSVDVLVVHTTG